MSTFNYDDTVSPGDVRVAHGYEPFRAFREARRALNKQSNIGLDRQTGRSTEVLCSEIAYLLGDGRRVVSFPFMHPEMPKTHTLANHDRRRFDEALARLGVTARAFRLREPWMYEYVVEAKR